MVKIIHKQRSLEDDIRLFFGGEVDHVDNGFNLPELRSDATTDQCVWIPKDLKRSSILCPSIHMRRVTQFAEYMEKKLGIEITIQEI